MSTAVEFIGGEVDGRVTLADVSRKPLVECRSLHDAPSEIIEAGRDRG